MKLASPGCSPLFLGDLSRPRRLRAALSGHSFRALKPAPGERTYRTSAAASGRQGAEPASAPPYSRACGPASGHVTAAQVSTASGVGNPDSSRLRLPLSRVRGRPWRPPRLRRPPYRRQQRLLVQVSASPPKPRKSISCSRR